MSTLKTHNLQSPDSGSANISLTPNAGMVVAGVSTLGSGSSGGVDLHYQNVSRMSTASYGIAVNGSILIGDAIIHGGDSDTKISFPTNDTITAETAGTERVRITSEGTNVTGISTFNNGNVNGITFPLNVKQDNNDNDYDMGTGIKLQGGSSTEFYKWCALVARGDNNGVGGYSNSQALAFYTYNNYGLSGGTEKLRITGAGTLLKGHTTASTNIHDAQTTTDREIGIQIHGSNTIHAAAALISWNDSHSPFYSSALYLAKSGSDTFGTNAVVTSDDTLGNIVFSGDDGTDFVKGAKIEAHVDGTPGTSDMPTRLMFYTNTGSANVTERLRIASAGQFGIGGANYGTSGQVLSSQGSSSAPTWSGGAQRILEIVTSVCDGSTISSSNGNVTFPNVTGQQNLTTSFADIAGSIISYQPPSGTTQVIYEFHFQMSRLDATVISHYRLYLDSNEVTKARSEMSGEDLGARTSFKWVFNIGGSADTTVGRVASWNSAKTMKWQAEDYGSSYDVQLHETNWWNSGGTDQFSMPIISLTAIGV